MTQFGGSRLGSWGSKEEEGGYEYAAYHPGAENGREAHVEAATLEEKEASFGPSIQTLEEGGQQSSKSGSGVVKLCEEASDGARAAPALCARYASIFSEAEEFVKHAAKSAWHKFVKVVHYIINARNRQVNGVNGYSSSQTASGCEVAGFLTTFGSPFVTVGKSIGFAVGGPTP